MNVFSAVKSLFGGNDKSGKVADFAMDSVKEIGNWIDEKDFTPEEKSKAYAESAKNYLEFIKLTVNENSLRSVTRRWLAWGIVGYILFWGSVMMVYAINDKDTVVDKMIRIVEALNLGWAFVAVCTLYFGVQFFRK